MTQMKIVKLHAYQQHGTVLIAPDDSVWVTICLEWWNWNTWLWWWLAPTDKCAWVVLTANDGKRVRTRAVRIAKKHIVIKGVPGR